MNRIIIFFSLGVFLFGIQINSDSVPKTQCPELDCPALPSQFNETDCNKTETTYPYGDTACPGCPSYSCDKKCPQLDCIVRPQLSTANCFTVPTFYPYYGHTCLGCPHFHCAATADTQVALQSTDVGCPQFRCASLVLPSNYVVERDCNKTVETYKTFSGKICQKCPTYECTDPDTAIQTTTTTEVVSTTTTTGDTTKITTCPDPICDPLHFPPSVDITRDCTITRHRFTLGNLNCEGCPIYECRTPPSTVDTCPDSICTLPNLPRGLSISNCVKTPTSYTFGNLICNGCPTYNCTQNYLNSAIQDSNQQQQQTSSDFPLSPAAALTIGIACGFVVVIIIAIIMKAISKKNKSYNEIL
jgi:hypothetical protein